MLICYNEGKKRVTRDFSSIEMVKTKGGLFTPAKFDIVGKTSDLSVVLYKGLSEKKAKKTIGYINIDCANRYFGGGVHNV